MIIIKIIILYFIQISHSEEFPSTGTRLIGFLTARASATNNSPRALGFNVGINITKLIFSGELPNTICNNM